MKNSKLDKLAKQYIIDCIDSSGYDIELKTDEEKLRFVAKCFQAEYLCKNTLLRDKTYQNCIAQWFMGLPSVINIDFENYKIIEIAKKWGSISENATDKQIDKILNNWFLFISAKFLQLLNKYHINYYLS